MNRIIKFRCWNGEAMVSPDYITRDGFAHWKENSIPTISKELMQYTGLNDRNGVEIYEGDCVVYEGKAWEVQFIEDYAGYEISRSLRPHGENAQKWFMCDVACRSEVIGNIHDKLTNK